MFPDKKSEKHTSVAKNLSVNRESLPPANQGSGELYQSGVTSFGLLETDKQFAESIEPGVGSFHNPASRFGIGVTVFDEPLFGARLHAWIVVMRAGDLADRIAYVASVQAEILVIVPPRDFRTLDDNLSQRPIQ